MNSSPNNNNLIFNRKGHCCFVYKNWIYFYGGQEKQSIHFDENQQLNDKDSATEKNSINN
jgi:hypothetical protein